MLDRATAAAAAAVAAVGPEILGTLTPDADAAAAGVAAAAAAVVAAAESSATEYSGRLLPSYSRTQLQRSETATPPLAAPSSRVQQRR